MSLIKLFISISFFFLCLNAAPLNEQLKPAAFDTNNDGKPDQQQLFQNSNQLEKVEYDTNYNREIDKWEYYDSSDNLARVELDSNQDGNLDLIKKKE